MEKYDAEAIVKTYQKKFAIWCGVAFLSAFFILFLPINFGLSILLAITVCLGVLMISAVTLRKKYVLPLMCDNLDPRAYIDVIIKARINTKYAIDELLAAFYLNDYQTVVNICELKLKDKKCRTQRINYLNYLARVYFDLGDYSKLQRVCDEFFRETDKRRNGDLLRNKYVIFTFYRLYLAGEFEECYRLYDGYLSKKFNHKLEEVQLKYTYAIACLKTDRIEKSEEIFRYIINQAPNLNLAFYSHKYLREMNGEAVDCKVSAVEAEPEFSMPKHEKVKLQPMSKTRKNVLIVCIIVLAISVFHLAKMNYDKIAETPFEAIEKQSSISELVGTYDVGEEKNSLCLYRSENGTLFVAYVDCLGESKYRYVFSCDRGVEIGRIVNMEIGCKDVKFSYTFLDDYSVVPSDTAEVYEFEDHGEIYYFCITNVEKAVLWDWYNSWSSFETLN